MFQFHGQIIVEPADMQSVNQRVVYENRHGNRCFDIFCDSAVLQAEVFLGFAAAPGDGGVGKVIIGIGHRGFSVVEPGDAGYKEIAENVSFFLQVLGMQDSLLF